MRNTRRLVKISPLFLALSMLSEGFAQAEERTVIDHTATTIQKELISGGLLGGGTWSSTINTVIMAGDHAIVGGNYIN